MKLSLEKPPYNSGVKRMDRSPSKNPNRDVSTGKDLRPENKAGYGLAQGVQPTRMPRTVGKGKGGNGFSLSADGPKISSRTAGGKNRTVGSIKFGTEGV